MLSPFLLPPLKNPISHFLFPYSPINPLLLPCPGIPLTAALSLSRTKGLSFLWYLTRPYSAGYVSGAMGNSMCTLWLKVLPLGSLGVLGDSYCFSSCGAANTFSSLFINIFDNKQSNRYDCRYFLSMQHMLFELIIL